MRNVELESSAPPYKASTRRPSGETTVRNNASSLRFVLKSFATAANLSRSSISDDGGETSGDNRYARLRAGTSRNTRGVTFCRSITFLHPVARSKRQINPRLFAKIRGKNFPIVFFCGIKIDR